MHGTGQFKTEVETFRKRFAFRKDGGLLVGIEREGFVTKDDEIVPYAHDVLEETRKRRMKTSFGYELSACQIETRIGPCLIGSLEKELRTSEEELREALRSQSLDVSYKEVAPETMPLDVYPDPSGRYARLVESMPEETLRAACRVAGLHVHIGMPDHETALRVFNQVIASTKILMRLCDESRGERLALYRAMKPDFLPHAYGSWEEFYKEAVLKGFVENPRDNWALIRLTVHGTIEFRMFGATDNLQRVCEVAGICHSLCADAIG